MSLVVITGGARSGKSGAAQRLAQSRRPDVIVVVAAHADGDEEMERRIRKHQEDRPAGFRTVEAVAGGEWRITIPADGCVVIDCLGSILSDEFAAAFDACDVTGEIAVASRGLEEAAQHAADDLVSWIVQRAGDTVVVTNEVGSGVVPSYPSARLFRDVIGRTNRALVDVADAAYLSIAGRLIDLASLPTNVPWPDKECR